MTEQNSDEAQDDKQTEQESQPDSEANDNEEGIHHDNPDDLNQPWENEYDKGRRLITVPVLGTALAVVNRHSRRSNRVHHRHIRRTSSEPRHTSSRRPNSATSPHTTVPLPRRRTGRPTGHIQAGGIRLLRHHHGRRKLQHQRHPRLTNPAGVLVPLVTLLPAGVARSTGTLPTKTQGSRRRNSGRHSVQHHQGQRGTIRVGTRPDLQQHLR